MAQIQDVKLKIVGDGNDDKLSVTVGFDLAFSQAEAGKVFKYGISLFGESPRGDDEPSSFKPTPLLYSFTFGNLFNPKQYKAVTAQPGTQSFSETREVATQKLNEDPGKDVIRVGVPPTIVTNPHTDEVFAVVHLVSEDARSPTVTLFI